MQRQYPSRPIVAVGVVIRDGDRVVLIRRSQEPSMGRWSFPGGVVRLGEALAEAARREALEETGLHVEVGEVLCVIDAVDRDPAGRVRYHYVIVDLEARPAGGHLKAGSDASDIRWVGTADLEGLDITDRAEELVYKLLRNSDAPRRLLKKHQSFLPA